MDPLERIRSLIPGFAGYDGAPARRLADEQVRAYAGERLAALRAGTASPQNVPPSPAGEDGRLEKLLLRAEFANQHAFRGFDETPTAAQIAAVSQADAQVLDAANTLDLASLERAFDARDAAMQNG